MDGSRRGQGAEPRSVRFAAAAAGAALCALALFAACSDSEGGGASTAAVAKANPPLAPGAGAAGTADSAAPDYLVLNFEELTAFQFNTLETPPEGESFEFVPEGLPKDVLALDKKRVSITGYMFPLNFKNGKTTRFFFLKDLQFCCFGIPPGPNEWIVVEMPGEGVPVSNNELMVLKGEMEVAERWKDGYFVGLFHLAGESLVASEF